MIFRTIAAVLAMSLCMTAVAQDTSAKDEETFVRATRQLEAAPLDDTDKRTRACLLQWVIDSPDISVLMCDVMESRAADGTPHAGIYVTQMVFGNAAYQIANPDKRSDPLAPQLAGVRSALRAYESIIAKEPEARVAHFDALLEKDKDRRLSQHLAPIVEEKCKAPRQG